MIFSLAIASALVAVAFAGCKDSTYTQIAGGDCFKVYQVSRTFSDAELVCMQDGGDLASVHNSVEEQGIASLVMASGKSAVLGLQCTSTSNCGWTDGTPYDYTSFNGGVPSLAYGNCAAVSPIDGLWYSQSCTDVQSAIVCRMKGTPIPSNCGDYSSYNGFCVQVKRSPRTALDAEADCAVDGGHLVSIHGETENTYYKNLLVSNRVNGTVHIGLRNNNGYYQWTDGSSVDYTNWAQFFPNSRFGDCVQMIVSTELGTLGQWNNEGCAVPYPYICKRASGYAPTMAPMVCPNLQLFEDAGIIYSPGYPVSFPPKSRCEYLLTGLAGTRVQIYFPVFYTDASSSVSLYDGMVASNSFAVLSGNLGFTNTYTTTGNILKLVFQAGNTVSGQGWQASFTTNYPGSSPRPITSTTTPRPTTTPYRPPPTTFAPTTSCPKQQYDADTTITSPGYPGRYGGGMVCSYFVRNPFLARLNIDFGAIDLTAGSTIAVYDGNSSAAPVLGVITGQANPHSYTYVSKGYWLTIIFRSAVGTTGVGFTAQVRQW